MSKKSGRQDTDQLRKSAEAKLARRAPLTGAPARPAVDMLHELQVHQIELEMQNEAMRQAQVELEESRDRYVDLYEFAPVGYLTLTPEAMISKINLTGAALLGEERKKLLDRRFERFIVPEDRDRWHVYFMQVLEKSGAHGCELEFQRGDGSGFNDILDCICIKADSGTKAVRVTFTDISRQKKTENELREYHQLLREMSALAVASREAEFKHIAREVHDELGQLLTALRMDVSLLRIQFGKRDPILMEKIKNILALADKAIQGVRDVTANLRPAALDMGIVPAIRWLCDNFSGRADTACTLRVVDHPSGLDDARTVAMFRIVQESLTNVARYAGANSVEIMIGQHGDDAIVEVRDDGKGFDPASIPAKKSFGLMGMRERALAVGGKVEIASAPSEGTVVSVRIPIKSWRDIP